MGHYVIWQPGAGQTEADGTKCSARSANEAAEEWAWNDDINSNEFHIVGGQPAIVTVRFLDTGEAFEFVVSGESRREYTARLRIPLVAKERAL